MKRSLFICLLAVLLCLSACGAPAADNPGTTDTKPVDTSAVDTKMVLIIERPTITILND